MPTADCRLRPPAPVNITAPRRRDGDVIVIARSEATKQSKSHIGRSGLLTWGVGVSRRLVSSLFDWRPALRPDRGSMEMARADRVKAGPQGRREAAWP